jgi:hypothetical protein
VKSTAEILAALTNGGRTPGPLAELLCSDCAEALDITGVGIALMSETEHQGVVGASDPMASELEELQFQLGEGPCIDASRDQRPVLLPDVAGTAAALWPVFGPAALDAGVRAIFAFPLNVGAIRLGVLVLYRTTPGQLTRASGSRADVRRRSGHPPAPPARSHATRRPAAPPAQCASGESGRGAPGHRRDLGQGLDRSRRGTPSPACTRVRDRTLHARGRSRCDRRDTFPSPGEQ